MKEGNGDGTGTVLYRVQGDALWVTYLSNNEVASDSIALSETMVPE